MTAVARTIPGNPPITIDGQSIPDFQGGGVGISSGLPGVNLNALLRTDAMSRVAGGTWSASPGADWTGSTFNYTANSGSVKMVIQGGGTLAATNSTMTADGGVINIDPPTNVNVNGVVFMAVAPNLVAPPPPPPPPAPATPTTSFLILPPEFTPPLETAVAIVVAPNLTSPSGTILPTDSTKQYTTTAPIYNERSCVPMEIANGEKDPNGWSVASGACQAFSYQSDDGASVTGTGGTAVQKTGDNSLAMKHGKLVAMSGSKSLTVQTSSGLVTLPADSAAIIQEEKDGIVRVEYLDGDPATVKVTKNGETRLINAEQGQEVVIADSDADDEELIPTDGVERIAISASIKFSDVQIQKNKFDRRLMVTKDPLINCTAGCLPTRVRTRMHRLKEGIASKDFGPEMPSTELPLKTGARNPFRPVAEVSSAAATPRMSSVDTANGTLRYMTNAQMTVLNDGLVKLNQGELLVVADKQLSIETSEGMVELAPDTVAVVRRKGDVVSVSVIYATNNDSVRFVSSGRAVKVAVGGELLGSLKPRAVDSYLKADSTGRRRQHMGDLPAGGSVVTSEVPLTAVLSSTKVLREMFKSEADEDKGVCKKVSKAAVALSIITARHGNYQQGH
jgi:hypothetical protein